MNTAYFIRRSSLFVNLRLSNGKKTEWSPCFEGGLLKTTDELTIKELRQMGELKKGGVREISETEYEDFKKKPERKRPAPQWQPMTTPPIPEPAPKKVEVKSVAAVETEPAAESPKPKKTQSKPETAKGVLEP